MLGNGYVPIEDIQIGDKVWSFDENTSQVSLKTVDNTFIKESAELTHITVNGEVISATPEHPFYVPVKGWVYATDLRAGDVLFTVNGEYVTVEAVQHEILESPVKVYNFEVAENHTYFVGSFAVGVHNANYDAKNIKFSKNDWGHTWERHGSGCSVESLRGRANSLNRLGKKMGPQGQWLHNTQAHDLLKNIPISPGKAVPINIPEGLGRAIMEDGSIVATNKAIVVFNKVGKIITAYPIL